jgi:hypothetical protein
MRIRPRLTYANVTATLALFVALGGGAYAVSNVGSDEIKNGSIRSVDLKNRAGVRGKDVKRDSIGGKEVKESSLDASRFAPVVGSEPGDCNPETSAFVTCADTNMNLDRPSAVLAIATGGQESDSGAASARCEIRVDGDATPFGANPGEVNDNTSAGATNGFARTIVTPEPLAKGSHEIALACNQITGNVRIDSPTIAAIAIATK